MAKERAVMSVDLELLADILKLPDTIRLVAVSPSIHLGFRRNAAVLLIEGAPLDPVENCCRAPYVRAVYKTDSDGAAQFIRFEKEDCQED